MWIVGFVTLDQPQPTHHVNINTLGSTLNEVVPLEYMDD